MDNSHSDIDRTLERCIKHHVPGCSNSGLVRICSRPRYGLSKTPYSRLAKAKALTSCSSSSTGLPFSTWLGTIDRKRVIPVHAAMFSQVVACLLALIYIGSRIYLVRVPKGFKTLTSPGRSSRILRHHISRRRRAAAMLFSVDRLRKFPRSD
jgi:hypothetical protein